MSTGAGTGPADDPAVDSVDADLGARAARSGALIVVSNSLQLITGIAATAFLARLLSPVDFGVYFMAAMLVELASKVFGFGFAMATVQAPDVDAGRLSAAFWVNVRLGAVVLALLVASGPLVGAALGESLVGPMTAVVGFALFLQGISVVHLGLLQRNLRFGLIAAIEVGTFVAGAVAGIGAAAFGAGPWALAVQYATVWTGRAAVLWLACPFRPHWPSSAVRASITSLRRYSTNTTAARVVTFVGRDADRLVVAASLGARALGLYQNAYRWSLLPVHQIYNPLLSVVVSVLSRLRSRSDRYRATFRTVLLSTTTVTAAAVGFLAVEAPSVIEVLLGSQWGEAVPLFRLLLGAAAASSVVLSTKWLYYAEGTTGRQLRWALLAVPIKLAAVLAGLPWGAAGVASGFTIAACAEVIPAVAWCTATSPVRTGDLWRSVSRPFIAAAVAGVVLLATAPALPSVGSVARLGIAGALYAAIYAVCWVGLPGGRAQLRQLAAVTRSLFVRPAMVWGIHPYG